MTLSAQQKMTMADYLAYEPETDERFELENGELVLMPPESRLNDQIASFLFASFLNHGVPFYQLTMKTEVAVSGSRATVRVPDDPFG